MKSEIVTVEHKFKMTELNRLVVEMANSNFSPFGHGPVTASMTEASGLALSSLSSPNPKSATERVLKVLQYSSSGSPSSGSDPERNLRSVPLRILNK